MRDDAFLRHRESEHAIFVATKKSSPAATSFLSFLVPGCTGWSVCQAAAAKVGNSNRRTLLLHKPVSFDMVLSGSGILGYWIFA